MRRSLLIIAAALAAVTAKAQTDLGLWTEAEAQWSVTKKLQAGMEAELRTANGLEEMGRWSLGANVDWAPAKWLAAGAGYSLQDTRHPAETTKKGNVVDAYWQLRHRIFAQARFKTKLSALRLSLRLRYQLTHKCGVSVAKYSASGTRKDNEEKEAENVNALRARLGINVKTGTRLTPFATYELFNDIDNGLALAKQRISAGMDIKLNKHNALSVGYARNIFSDSDDDDQKTHNAILLGYKLDF